MSIKITVNVEDKFGLKATPAVINVFMEASLGLTLHFCFLT